MKVPTITLIRKSQNVSLKGPDCQKKPVGVTVHGKKGLATLWRNSIKPFWQEEGSERALSAPNSAQPQRWDMWRGRRRRERTLSLKPHIQWIANVDSDLTWRLGSQMIDQSLPVLIIWPLFVSAQPSSEVITQSQKTWDGISTLSLPCVILGKLLSLNDLVYKIVIITPSSQVCSSDTIHHCYSCKLWDGCEISEDSQRHQGAFHPQTDLTSPELPAHPSFWSLWDFSPKEDLAAEQGALCKWPGELSPSRAAAPSFVKEEFWGYQKGSQIVFGKTIAK